MSQKHGEVDLAEQQLNRLGYVAKIFSFDHVPDRKLGSDIEPPVEAVIITNTENQKQKIYRVEDTGTWSQRFLDDVRAGWFGKPPKGLDQ